MILHDTRIMHCGESVRVSSMLTLMVGYLVGAFIALSMCESALSVQTAVNIILWGTYAVYFMEVLGCCCPLWCIVQCQEKSKGVPHVAWSFFMSVDIVFITFKFKF